MRTLNPTEEHVAATAYPHVASPGAFRVEVTQEGTYVWASVRKMEMIYKNGTNCC